MVFIMTIGVAILGGGIFAREEHKPAVEASSHLTLKAVYSRSLKSAKTLESGSDVDLYSDDSGSGKGLEDLLKRDDIQAVIIALPIKNQPPYIKQALLAGKHVLSEKPVAENVQDGKELIDWYEKEIVGKGGKSPTWGVAENMRYMPSLDRAAEVARQKGRILTWRLRQQGLLEGGKFYETEWRKSPTHQGGFLLDGGVHFIAIMRQLLGRDEPIVTVSAQTAQLQQHLPPVDTIEAVAKTKSGSCGTISLSFGTTGKGTEYTVACEKGVVTWAKSQTKVDGELKEDCFSEGAKNREGSGVTPEVVAWGEALAAGKENAKQSPKEALADLEFIEACLKSGQQGGVPIKLQYQTV